MTWSGVVYIMEEIQFPKECWETAELLWGMGDLETLLGMLNHHARDPKEGPCRALKGSALTTCAPAPPETWALEVAERLLARVRACSFRLLPWLVARLLEEEFERWQFDQAQDAASRLWEPPSPPADH